jgi:hypothetical protein
MSEHIFPCNAVACAALSPRSGVAGKNMFTLRKIYSLLTKDKNFENQTKIS